MEVYCLASAQEREAVEVNGLQDALGGDGCGVCAHPHSLSDLLAEAYARGHGLGGSAGFGALRAIRRQGGLERASLGQGAFASAAAALARLARRLAGLLALGSVCRWPASEIRPNVYIAHL